MKFCPTGWILNNADKITASFARMQARQGFLLLGVLQWSYPYQLYHNLQQKSKK